MSCDDSSNHECVIAALSRINICTPQTADVERSIKANNLLKTAFRNGLNLQTENKYMFVHFNMPALESWDPKPAITIWLNDKQRRVHIDIIQKATAKKHHILKVFLSWHQPTWRATTMKIQIKCSMKLPKRILNSNYNVVLYFCLFIRLIFHLLCKIEL